jgi:ornithine cyclodeaminase
VRVLDTWRETVDGADIVVEATRLPEPKPLLRTEWIAPAPWSCRTER